MKSISEYLPNIYNFMNRHSWIHFLYVNWKVIWGSHVDLHFTHTVLRQTLHQSEWKSTCITWQFSESTWSPAADVISAFQSKSMQSFNELFIFFLIISDRYCTFIILLCNVTQWVLVFIFSSIYIIEHTLSYTFLFQYERWRHEDVCGKLWGL